MQNQRWYIDTEFRWVTKLDKRNKITSKINYDDVISANSNLWSTWSNPETRKTGRNTRGNIGNDRSSKGNTMWNTGKRKRKEGKHVHNCCFRGFLRHLVTSFQTASYIDRTTRKCWGISIVFHAHFSFWSDQESVHEAKWQSEAADVVMCVYLDFFCDTPDIIRYTWV